MGNQNEREGEGGRLLKEPYLPPSISLIRTKILPRSPLLAEPRTSRVGSGAEFSGKGFFVTIIR